MQVLCYNHKGHLKAIEIKDIYPVGAILGHIKGPLLEEIRLKVIKHVPGEEYDLAGVMIMMVEPLIGCKRVFQQKAGCWFSLEMFVSPEMFVH